MRELLMLQFGGQANYAGAHFWNAQEACFTYDDGEPELEHDVHFRVGLRGDSLRKHRR